MVLSLDYHTLKLVLSHHFHVSYVLTLSNEGSSIRGLSPGAHTLKLGLSHPEAGSRCSHSEMKSLCGQSHIFMLSLCGDM